MQIGGCNIYGGAHESSMCMAYDNASKEVFLSNHKSTESVIKNLEVQVSQLAKQLAKKSTGNFVTNTENNPKEECKTIFTRSKKRESAEKRAEGVLKDVSNEEGEDKKREDGEKEKIEAAFPHATKSPPWTVPFDAEPLVAISLAANDDTKGIPILGCLARSPTSFCRGGDTSGIGNDDAPETEVDANYVADITAAQGAWDPGPPQD
ncbi:hypothetical protein HKD37_01G000368 [Glycine soja]